jgi:hypothetical protein
MSTLWPLAGPAKAPPKASADSSGQPHTPVRQMAQAAGKSRDLTAVGKALAGALRAWVEWQVKKWRNARSGLIGQV